MKVPADRTQVNLLVLLVAYDSSQVVNQLSYNNSDHYAIE